MFKHAIICISSVFLTMSCSSKDGSGSSSFDLRSALETGSETSSELWECAFDNNATAEIETQKNTLTFWDTGEGISDNGSTYNWSISNTEKLEVVYENGARRFTFENFDFKDQNTSFTAIDTSTRDIGSSNERTLVFNVECVRTNGSSPFNIKFSTDSYYPIDAISSSGELAEQLVWNYVIVGDSSITIEESGIFITMEFPEFTAMVDTATSTRNSVLKGSLSVTDNVDVYPGNYSVELDEFYGINTDGQSTIESARLKASFTVTDSFGDLATVSDLTVSLLEPTPLFLDRTMFSDLVNSTFDQHISAGTVTGSISQTGLPTRTLNSITAATSESYQVIEILESLSVQGTEYLDVVVIDYTYDSLDPRTNQIGKTTSRYHLAPGIGLIKGNNLNNFYGTPLNWELANTNLEQ